MCHLTCSGPWCQQWLFSWCLPRLLPPWHVVLLSSGFVAASDRWCHVMCFWASYGFLMFLMSGFYIFDQPDISLPTYGPGCHDVLCQHIFESKGCGNTTPGGVGTCDEKNPTESIMKYVWNPPSNIVNIKNHQESNITCNIISYIVIICYNMVRV